MRRTGLLVMAVVSLVAIQVTGLTPGAHADTPGDTLYGEGGDAITPVMIKLLKDDGGQLNPLFGAYTNVGLDQGIADFIGSAPNTFAADYAMTERPLTSAEAATAKADGRSYAYVPIAALPVALMTLVPQGSFNGGTTINASQYCQHIPLTLDQLDGIFGEAATPYISWSSGSITCSIGGAPPDQVPITAWANLDPTMENSAVMSLLDSTTASTAAFEAGLTTQKSRTTDTTPSEQWPYLGHAIPGGDEDLLGKLIAINSLTNLPGTQVAQLSIGAIAPVTSIWTNDPLGAHWNLPTAAIQNAQGAFVAPSTAAAVASEGDAQLVATSDPTTNNLVTFNASTTDAAAYNNFLMLESYLVVPTSGLPPAKEVALAQLIRFALGTAGQKDISGLGAAPATPAMVSAGLLVAQELDSDAASNAGSTTTTTTAGSGTTTTTTTTTAGSSTSTTTTTTASGSGSTDGSGSSSGSSSSGTGGSGDSSSASGGSGSSGGLAFTGSSPFPILGVGLVLLIAGEVARRSVRRRMLHR